MGGSRTTDDHHEMTASGCCGENGDVSEIKICGFFAVFHTLIIRPEALKSDSGVL